MASVRSAHKSCLVLEQGSLKPHNLVSQTLNFVQEKPFFYLYVCFYKCQNGINFVQEKPLYFGFICVSANVNVIVNKQLFLIWSGRHSVWNVRQVLKLERFLCNWTISIIDGGDISFIHLQALNNRLMVSIYHPLLLFVAHPKLLNQSYYSFEKVATLKLSLILFGVSNSSCKRENTCIGAFLNTN